MSPKTINRGVGTTTLIFQYGNATINPGTTRIVYPTSFTSINSVPIATRLVNNSGGIFYDLWIQSKDRESFTVAIYTAETVKSSVLWFAIGY